MKILIVDDSAHIRLSLKKSLKLIPIVTTVLEAEDVNQGVNYINKHKPELVILDLMLGKETGIDLIKRIKDHSFKPKIILYSNFLNDQYKIIAQNLGVKLFFDKSDDILNLVDLIKKNIKVEAT